MYSATVILKLHDAPAPSLILCMLKTLTLTFSVISSPTTGILSQLPKLINHATHVSCNQLSSRTFEEVAFIVPKRAEVKGSASIFGVLFFANSFL